MKWKVHAETTEVRNEGIVREGMIAFYTLH